MDITITDVVTAIEMIKASPGVYRVVSILREEDRKIPSFRKEHFQDAREILYLNFADTTRFSALEKTPSATTDDCRQALEFLGEKGKVLVHCAYGQSRSTAVVLGYLLQEYESYQEAVDRLYEIRSCATPNPHILQLMCHLLKKEANYMHILSYIETLHNKPSFNI